MNHPAQEERYTRTGVLFGEFVIQPVPRLYLADFAFFGEQIHYLIAKISGLLC